MRVAGLSEDLEQRWIRDKEESGEDETFLLEVSRQRLLTDLQLFEKMWQELTESVVTHAADDNIGVLVSAHHDLMPRLVNVAETFRFLK